MRVRMNEMSYRRSLARYGADRWGRDFLRVNAHGNLSVEAPGLPPVDLHGLALFLAGRGVQAPFVVRFPSLIQQRIEQMREAFAAAIKANEYAGAYVGLYPLKVNPRRSVVEAVMAARAEHPYGLEAGSKPELFLAMVQRPVPGTPLVCNGFKDLDFIQTAFHAAELGHEVVLVMESLGEIERYIVVAQRHPWRAHPLIGMRAKLYSRGSGRWQSSGGELAKFGLTTMEMLELVRQLDVAGMLDRLALLHFHIGSQITQIKRVKRAAREAARLWASLAERTPGMRYLDLGGGIGVDYDGSRTSHESSVNYSLDEYASQVVYEVSEVCIELGISPPDLVTESGRILVADSAVTVADLREVQGRELPLPEPPDREHRVIEELRYVLQHLSVKNLEEFFHDALDYRDEALDLFARGYLSLEDRAAAEGLFQRIRRACARLVRQLPRPPEEIVEYLDRANHKYLANFSVFQSLPDAWSVDQVFPAAPLSRHGEIPTVNASIVDITCDSDGCVRRYAHPDENLSFLPLHEPNGEPYYVGFFKTGAYQDSLANEHNLFARCHEVIVWAPETAPNRVSPGAQWINWDGLDLEVRRGMSNDVTLESMDFDLDALSAMLNERHLDRDTTLGEPWAAGVLRGYPYLVR
jgi:arginine decarboxylase